MTWFYGYLAIAAAALIIELVTSDLVSIWFTGGGAISAVLAACGTAWYVHLPVFIIVSLVLLVLLRKIALKYLLKGEVKTNAEAIVGKEFRLLKEIKFGNAGEIKVNDVVWSAVCEDADKEIKKGALVKVKRIEGNKYIVEEIEK